MILASQESGNYSAILASTAFAASIGCHKVTEADIINYVKNFELNCCRELFTAFLNRNSLSVSVWFSCYRLCVVFKKHHHHHQSVSLTLSSIPASWFFTLPKNVAKADMNSFLQLKRVSKGWEPWSSGYSRENDEEVVSSNPVTAY